MKVTRLLLAALIPLAACDELTSPNVDPDAPAHVTYQLIPSGDPNAPAGVLLSWDVPSSGRANSFNVYARSSTSAQWLLRATTTSPTFHDAGTPSAQYYVATRDVDGNEIAQSAVVTIDLSARLPAPTGLLSTSLNAAIHLRWNSNAVDASHGTFDYYRVYSSSYDATRGACNSDWSVEGTTVSDGFLSGNMTNGVSRCFAVSAVSRDGHESNWSATRVDTPRFDARNAFVYATAVKADSAAFAFFDDATKKLGLVGASSRTDLDFTVERHSDGSLWFNPARSGVTMMLYSNTPVVELTSIDRAPASGFAGVTIEALPGYAYIFRITKADGVHFAAIRVAFVTSDYIVFDWSYQAASGNPELSRSPTN
jgi:hypothetical protein